MAEKLRFDLEFNAKAAQTEMKNAAKAAQQLGDDLDDSRSSAEKVADAIRAVGQNAASDLKAAQAASDALATALGPELAAKAQQGQGGIDGIVAKLTSLGLSYDDVVAEADRLASAIRDADHAISSVDRVKSSVDEVGDAAKMAADQIQHMDDAADGFGGVRAGTQGLEGDFRKLGGEADNTRSVVANFTGNAVQELPGVAGALGPLNMAMGQFGEYAAEGNIGLKNFIGAGLGLGAVSVVLSAIGSHFEKIAKIKAFNADQVNEYREAIEKANEATDDGVDAVKSLADQFREAGKIEAVPLFGDEVRNLIPDLFKAEAGVEQYVDMVIRGGPAFYEFKESQAALGRDMDATQRVIEGAATAHDNYAKAQEVAYQTSVVMTGATEDEAKAVDDTTKAIDLATRARINNASAEADATAAVLFGIDATEAAEQASKDRAAALEDEKAKLRALYDEELSQLDAKYAFKRATEDNADALDRYNQTLGDSESTIKDQRDATNQAFDASVRMAEAFAKAQGAAAGSKESIDLQVGALGYFRDSLAPGSPLRAALDEYIADLGRIPTNIATNLKLNVQFAEQRDFGGAAFGAPATAAANAAYAKAIDDELKRRGKAKGGPVRKDEVYVVGEDGPELFIANSAGQIVTNREAQRILNPPPPTPVEQSGLSTWFNGNGAVEAAEAAQAAAKAAKDIADAQIREQDRIKAAEYETGRISLQQYRDYVKGRQAASAELSEDWVQQFRLIQQLNEKEKTDAVAAADAQAAAQDKVQAAMFRTGKISLEQYQEYLRGRLGAFEEYSDGYMAIYDLLERLRLQAEADQKKAIDEGIADAKKIYDAAQAAKAVLDAEDRQAEDIRELNSARGALAKARGSARADAQAAADDAAQKAAQSIYSTAAAKAAAEGFNVGTVEWDRMMRALLEAAIGVVVGTGAENYLQRFLDAIPGLAKGGPVRPGHPYIVGEDGPELLIPNEAGVVHPRSALGSPTYNFQIHTPAAVTVDTISRALALARLQ